MRKLGGAVVVLTGASRGIGRATAVALAKQGCDLVLAARNADALDEVAAECRSIGSQVLTVPADISREEQVQGIATAALRQFGHFDIWINNAAVAAFGRFTDVPSSSFARVIEVNVLGMANGCRAALQHFQQRNEGTLINVTSILGKQAIPYMSAYVSSKAAITALSAVLRTETRGSDIHVCTILPATIDTPVYQNSANYSGRQVRPTPPVYSPQLVADAIVRCAQQPQAVMYVGWAGWLLTAVYTVAPRFHEAISPAIAKLTMFQQKKAASSDGNLYRCSTPVSVDGGWRASRRKYAVAAGVVGALGVLAAAAMTKAHGTTDLLDREQAA